MADAFPVTIYHNPDCGTSRNTLAMIRAAGCEPLVVEYLKTGWSRELIEALLRDLGILVNRPVVATPLGVKLCRPSEVVLTLLDEQPAAFTKEDGEVVRISQEP